MLEHGNKIGDPFKITCLCLRKRYDNNSILKLVWEDLMTNDSLQYYVQMFLIMYKKVKDLREHLGTVHCLNTLKQ